MTKQELTVARIGASHTARIALELLETTCVVEKIEFTMLLLIEVLEDIQKVLPCTDDKFVDVVWSAIKKHRVSA